MINKESGCREITCTVCPLGCTLGITCEAGKVTGVSGYSCKRGLEYGWTESTDPRRMLTTTVRIEGSALPVLPVKSEKPLPKNLLPDCMNVINKVKLKVPIRTGDIIIRNILDTGINIVATRNS